DRVEYHSDYQAWLASQSSVETSIHSIQDKHLLGLDLSGNLLSYTYNLDNETAIFSVGAGLSLSKSNLMGTTLSGSLSPSYNLTNSNLNTNWSFSLRQTIWPAPSLSSDQITLAIALQNQQVLTEQYIYMVKSAQYKIEELYHSAQLSLERVAFAEVSLENAHLALRITSQKEAIGEASEVDLIAGQLGVLRAERDLESSIASAKTAKENLLTALDLEGDFKLSPLDTLSMFQLEVAFDRSELMSSLQTHPLVLHFEAEIEKARLELEATEELRKPEASLSLSLSEGSGERGQQLQAAVSIGYPILDRNQRKSTLKERQDNLEDVKEARIEAIQNVENMIEEAVQDLARLERDREIAQLSLKQAELELEAAQSSHQAGILDDGGLVSAELNFDQANLTYCESAFRYYLAEKRLSEGIVGDLPQGGLSR
ncbi:MAG TPA: TolC family protein, partial [Limnochordia bacterium]|nr:TolC family protein [Limnochordia bacterium]